MRRSLPLFGLLAVLVGCASAQQTAAHRGLFLGFRSWGSPPASAIGQVSQANQWTAWATTKGGPWPYWGDVLSATQEVDNHGVIVPAYDGYSGSNPVKYAFLVWDPASRAIVSTIWSGTFGAPGDPQTLTNLTLDSDGDLFSYDLWLDRYFEFDRFRGTWISTPGPHRRGWGGTGGLEWDKLHGGFLLATGQNSSEQALYRLSWDLSSSAVVASGMVNLRAWYGGGMLENGEWISSSAVGGTYILAKPSTARWEHGPVTPWGMFTDCTPEKYAAPGRAYYAAFSSSWSLINHGIAYVDATTTPHTIVGLVGGPFPNGVLSLAVTEVLPLHERDLCTLRSGKATWQVSVNPSLPRLSGHSFVLLASLAGATPPIRLPDGRQIFLRPDEITRATANGPLPPLLTGNLGTLDHRGMALANLDLTALGTAANGTVIHFAALVLDPAAPSGIAWVCEPWAFVVNVMP